MDKESLEAKKAHAEKEISQLENRQKILLNRIRKEERNARTSRLCRHGAILEGVFPAVLDADGEAIKEFLIALSRLPGAGALVVRPAGGCCVLADAMGSYAPQTPCAPGKTKHPLCVCSVFPGLYPTAVNTPKGGKTA